MKSKQSGFIVVLTVMLIATSVLIVSLVINRVAAFRKMGRLWVDTEKARMIALGGIDIAMSQLAKLTTEESGSQNEAPEKKDDKKSGDFAKKEAEKAKEAVHVLLDYVNTWQTFEFKDEIEGVTGQCKIYISSEHGKINLNALYDPQKKKFITQGTVDGKQFCDFISERLKPLLEKQKKKPIELATLVEKFFKNNKAFDDVSELLSSNDLETHLFIVPDQKGIAWTDVFTADSQKSTVDPMTFSVSLCQLLGIKRSKDIKKIQPEEIFKLMKSDKIAWEKSWAPVMLDFYGQEYATLPAEIKPFFATRFEPTLWSVVSYGKVGSITVKACAIIEKNKNRSEPFKIRKLYWL